MSFRDKTIMLVSICGYPEIKGGVNTITNNLAHGICERNKSILFTPGAWDNKKIAINNVNGIKNYTMRLRVPDLGKKIVDIIKELIGFFIEMPMTLFVLRKVVCSEKIDLIHIQTVSPHHVYFFLLKFIGGPRYIITLRGSEVLTFPEKNKFNQFLIKLSLRGASVVLANSKSLSALAKEKFGFLRRILVIYNGIAIPNINYASLTNNEKVILSILPDKFIVSVGSFDYVKGHDVLIKAWSKIQYNVNYKLVLVGDGDYMKPYKELADSLGCSKSIIFVGEVSNELALTVINKANIFVLPSRHEGFGNVLIEAGLLSVPIIATNVGGVPEIISNGNDGILVPSEDIEVLANEMEKLANDEMLQKFLSKNFYIKVHSKFTSDVMCRKTILIYKKVIYYHEESCFFSWIMP